MGTPAQAYTATPRAIPLGSPHGCDNRIRTDRVGTTGRSHPAPQRTPLQIGINRTHAGTAIVMVVQDLHITIAAAATSEILRDLTLDTTRTYRTNKRQNPNLITGVRAVVDVLPHHTGWS